VVLLFDDMWSQHTPMDCTICHEPYNVGDCRRGYGSSDLITNYELVTILEDLNAKAANVKKSDTPDHATISTCHRY
jgi:hypothetical protein